MYSNYNIVFLCFGVLAGLFFYILKLKPNKKTDIKEIGDIYISFNKSSKNFELLIEDLLIQETYLQLIKILLQKLRLIKMKLTKE